jgi:hypothetical protein
MARTTQTRKGVETMPTRLASVPEMQKILDRLDEILPTSSIRTFSEDGTHALFTWTEEGRVYFVHVWFDMDTRTAQASGTAQYDSEWSPITIDQLGELAHARIQN